MKELISIQDLDEYIDHEVKKAKKILAIGETNMNFRERYSKSINEWRFARLHSINKNIVGIDIVESNVNDAKKLGYNFITVNIENKNELKKLGNQKFDLIIMLDVIEHLSNIQNTMDNLKEILSENGKIIITTVSPFYYRQFYNRFFNIKIEIHEDHTVFIAPENMKQLCRRSDLKMLKWDAYLDVRITGIKKMLTKIIKRKHPYFLDHFIYIVTK